MAIFVHSRRCNLILRSARIMVWLPLREAITGEGGEDIHMLLHLSYGVTSV
jgi:hypothetical protein